MAEATFWHNVQAIATYDLKGTKDYRNHQLKAWSGKLHKVTSYTPWFGGTQLKGTVIVVKSVVEDMMQRVERAAQPLLVSNPVMRSQRIKFDELLSKARDTWSGIGRMHDTYKAYYTSGHDGLEDLSALNGQIAEAKKTLTLLQRRVGARLRRGEEDAKSGRIDIPDQQEVGVFEMDGDDTLFVTDYTDLDPVNGC